MACFEAVWLDGFETRWLDGFEFAWLDDFETGCIDTNMVVAGQLFFRSAYLFAGRSNSSFLNHLILEPGWINTNAVVAGQLTF